MNFYSKLKLCAHLILYIITQWSGCLFRKSELQGRERHLLAGCLLTPLPLAGSSGSNLWPWRWFWSSLRCGCRKEETNIVFSNSKSTILALAQPLSHTAWARALGVLSTTPFEFFWCFSYDKTWVIGFDAPSPDIISEVPVISKTVFIFIRQYLY